MQIPPQERCARCKKQLPPPQCELCSPCFYSRLEYTGGRTLRSLIETAAAPEQVAFIRSLMAEEIMAMLCRVQAAGFPTPSPGLSFADRARKAITETKKNWLEVRSLEELCRQAAAKNSIVTFLCLVFFTITIRRWVRRYVRSRFRYDLRRDRLLRGAHGPSTLHALSVYLVTVHMYAGYEGTFIHGLAALLSARAVGKDTHTIINEVLAAMLKANADMAVTLTGENMMKAPHSVLQEMAMVKLAGWVRTRLKLYPRHRKAMTDYGELPSDALFNFLPGGGCNGLGRA